jgi:hypothetical protein
VKNLGVLSPLSADATSGTPVPLVRGSKATRKELRRIRKQAMPVKTAYDNHRDTGSTTVMAWILHANKMYAPSLIAPRIRPFARPPRRTTTQESNSVKAGLSKVV